MAKHGKTRGMRDEMNVGPDPRQARHLVPLKELGRFKVADGEPDIRGWEVYTSTGREIGRVAELLVDTDSNEVVMLDVDLRRDDRHTLAPLRAAWIDHTVRRVVIDAHELQGAEDIPSLARTAAPTDDELRRFDEGYARTYGDYHDDRELRMRHDRGELRFGRRASDRTDVPAVPAAVPAAAPADVRTELRTDVRDSHDRLAASADRPVERTVDRVVDRTVERDVDPATGLAADAPHRSRFVERHRIEDAESYRVADRGEREVRFPRRDPDARP